MSIGADPDVTPSWTSTRSCHDPANRVVVCCGSGGVGKTTTAAAMALRAAEDGRTVVVLTIDPAKRLAQALGLKDLGNNPHAGAAGSTRSRRRASCTR